MLSKVVTSSIIILLSASLYAYADLLKPESITDKINASSLEILNQSEESIDAQMQSCESDETAVITVYSANGEAQVGIDVKLDGNPVGSLTTHYPEAGPECKTPGSEGIISIVIPAGKHTLDARSLNLVWPTHTFTIKKCQCLVLPLS